MDRPATHTARRGWFTARRRSSNKELSPTLQHATMLLVHLMEIDRPQFFFLFLRKRALLRIDRNVYIMSNELLDTDRHSLSPNSDMANTFSHLR